MRAERIVLRAKHLMARKGLEAMIKKLIAENQELRRLVGELRAEIEKQDNDAKLIRPATMQEASKILVTK